MAKDEKKRQARLAKKRRKDKARKEARARTDAPPDALQRARKAVREAQGYPVHECMINRSWREKGLVTILIARRQPNGRIAFGVFLVDVYCLGLKNTFWNGDFTISEYDWGVRGRMVSENDLVACPLDLAHTIIYGAIDYARQFGFEPHKDFKLSRHILQERDDFTWREDVEFGRDGMPLFVSGPHDNANRIIRQLQATAGEGNFHYLIGGPAGP